MTKQKLTKLLITWVSRWIDSPSSLTDKSALPPAFPLCKWGLCLPLSRSLYPRNHQVPAVLLCLSLSGQSTSPLPGSIPSVSPPGLLQSLSPAPSASSSAPSQSILHTHSQSHQSKMHIKSCDFPEGFTVPSGWSPVLLIELQSQLAQELRFPLLSQLPSSHSFQFLHFLQPFLCPAPSSTTSLPGQPSRDCPLAFNLADTSPRKFSWLPQMTLGVSLQYILLKLCRVS